MKTHVGRILTKLDLRDRVQVVVFAYETGLIRPGQDQPDLYVCWRRTWNPDRLTVMRCQATTGRRRGRGPATSSLTDRASRGDPPKSGSSRTPARDSWVIHNHCAGFPLRPGPMRSEML